MTFSTLEKKFNGIWSRANSESCLSALTPELIEEWARDKLFRNPVAKHVNVGVFNPTPCIVLTVEDAKACFPTIPITGDEQWLARRKQYEDQAALWDKVEWFAPLWLPMGEISKLLASVQHVTRESSRTFRVPHINVLYSPLPSCLY